MKNILHQYVSEFNENDNEYYNQDIKNERAESWLSENIPQISIPDKDIEFHISYVTPVIGASTGPGMIGAYYYGEKVTITE